MSVETIWKAMDEEPDRAAPWMAVAGDRPGCPVVYFDLETSGLDPRENGVVGIAAFAVGNPELYFAARTKIGPEEFMDMEALAVNGERTIDVLHNNSHRLDGAHALGLFREWLAEVFPEAGSVMLCGWNVHFDLAFLRAKYEGPRLRPTVGSRVIDLHSLVATMYPGEVRTDLTSDKAAALLGVPLETRPHRIGSGMVWGLAMCRALGLTREDGR